jgi:hypothetical protein
MAGYDCLFRDAWRVLRVVCACLSPPENLPSSPRPSLSLELCVLKRVLECLGLSLCVAEWKMMAM